MKYPKLIKHLVRISWMAAMEYRANFIIWSLVDVGWTIIDFVFISVLVSNIGYIGNWPPYLSIFIAGLSRLMVIPVWGWMYESFVDLPLKISEGRLDFILSKPADSQFLVSTSGFSFSVFPSIIGGLGFMIYGLILSKNNFHPILILPFIWLSIVSVCLMYGIYFLTMTLCLYTERLSNIPYLFTRLYDGGRYPKEIYNMFLRHLLTIFIPVALMFAVPVETLFSRSSLGALVWFHVLTIIFLILGRYFWQKGLLRYSSASS